MRESTIYLPLKCRSHIVELQVAISTCNINRIGSLFICTTRLQVIGLGGH